MTSASRGLRHESMAASNKPICSSCESVEHGDMSGDATSRSPKRSVPARHSAVSRRSWSIARCLWSISNSCHEICSCVGGCRRLANDRNTSCTTSDSSAWSDLTPVGFRRSRCQYWRMSREKVGLSDSCDMGTSYPIRSGPNRKRNRKKVETLEDSRNACSTKDLRLRRRGSMLAV